MFFVRAWTGIAGAGAAGHGSHGDSSRRSPGRANGRTAATGAAAGGVRGTDMGVPFSRFDALIRRCVRLNVCWAVYSESPSGLWNGAGVAPCAALADNPAGGMGAAGTQISQYAM